MKVTRIIILAVALGAGLLAALLMRNMMSSEPKVKVAENANGPQMDISEVLVASGDIQMGSALNSGDLSWQKWPKSGLNGAFITRAARPSAKEDLVGTIARTPILGGEPIKESRLIRSDRGFMSAILPKGKRAVAVEVRAVNTAGGFILPNDRVDVILTRQARRGAAGDSHVSETILSNIRVLAIDQKLSENEGEKTVVAQDTATLELNPADAETLAQAAQLGNISLALRSIADSKPDENAPKKMRRSGVSVVKYGVATRSMARQ